MLEIEPGAGAQNHIFSQLTCSSMLGGLYSTVFKQSAYAWIYMCCFRICGVSLLDILNVFNDIVRELNLCIHLKLILGFGNFIKWDWSNSKSNLPKPNVSKKQKCMHLLKVSLYSLEVDARMHSDFKYSLSFPLSVVVSGETLDLKAPFFLDLFRWWFLAESHILVFG